MTDNPRSADYSHLGTDGLETPTLGNNVAAHLRDSILSGKLDPGERLYEAALARNLGISRGPIREALALLEGDGLIESEPRRGKFVRRLDAQVIDEIYSLRAILEPHAAKVAIENDHTDELVEALEGSLVTMSEAVESGDFAAVARADIAFHRRIYESAGHRLLERVWKDLFSGPLKMLVNMTTPTHDREDPVQNHASIISTIKTGDVEKFTSALEKHVEDGWARARAEVRSLFEEGEE